MRYGIRACIALWTVALVVNGCGGGGGGAVIEVPDEPPSVALTSPTGDIELPLGSAVPIEIRYTDDDADSEATTTLLADRDGNLATQGDQVVISADRPEQDGAEQVVAWDVSSVPAGTYKLFAVTTDGTTTVVGEGPAQVLINTPPNVFLNEPSANVFVSRGATVQVQYTDNDPDDAAMTWVFADGDGNLDTTGDTHLLGVARPEQNGLAQTLTWDTTGVPFGFYQIMVMTWDGTNVPVVKTATGVVVIRNVAYAAAAGDVGSEVAYGVSGLASGESVTVGYYDTATLFGFGELYETPLSLTGGTDIFVAGYYNNGQLAWAKKAGGAGIDVANDVVAFDDGSCIVTGYFQGACTFGPGEAGETTLNAGGAYDLFLARYNNDGSLAWVKQAGGAAGAWCSGYAIDALSDGSVVVSGSFGLDATFGPGEGGATTLTWAGGLDVFVARFTSSGTLMWAKRAAGTGDQEALGISAFPDGSCAVTGYLTDTVVFGPGEPGATTLIPFGTQEVFVARYSSTGTLVWASQAGGSVGTAAGLDVSTFADGTCVVSGWFGGGMDFGYGEPNETNFVAWGDSDGFVARYGASGQLAWAVRQTGSSFDGAQAIEALPDGSCLVTGYFDGFAYFGELEPNQTLLFSTSPRDLFTCRLDAYGFLQWVTQEGSTSTTQIVPYDMTLHADGSFGIAGYFEDGSLYMGSGGNLAWPIFNAGGLDVFLAHYNADGGF